MAIASGYLLKFKLDRAVKYNFKGHVANLAFKAAISRVMYRLVPSLF